MLRKKKRRKARRRAEAAALAEVHCEGTSQVDTLHEDEVTPAVCSPPEAIQQDAPSDNPPLQMAVEAPDSFSKSKAKNLKKKKRKQVKKAVPVASLNVLPEPVLLDDFKLNESSNELFSTENPGNIPSPAVNTPDCLASFSQNNNEPLEDQCAPSAKSASPLPMAPGSISRNHATIFFHDPESGVHREEKEIHSALLQSPIHSVPDEAPQFAPSDVLPNEPCVTLFKPVGAGRILQDWQVSLPDFLATTLSQIEAECGVRAFIVGSFAELLINGEEPDCRRDIDIVLLGAPSLNEKLALGKTLQMLYPALHACHFNGLNLKLYQLHAFPWKIELFAADTTGSFVFLDEYIIQDAMARDFTKSAIYIDKEGNVFDPVKGIRDSRSGLIRSVCHPIALLQNDPARALRALYKQITEGCRLHPYLKKAMHSFQVSPWFFNTPEYYKRIYFFTSKALSRLDAAGCVALLGEMEHYGLGKLFSAYHDAPLPAWIYNLVAMKCSEPGYYAPIVMSK